eukprot:g5133.t1
MQPQARPFVTVFLKSLIVAMTPPATGNLQISVKMVTEVFSVSLVQQALLKSARTALSVQEVRLWNDKATHKGSQMFGKVKILVAFLQLLSAMPGVFDTVPWPKLFLRLSLGLAFVNIDVFGVLSEGWCSLAVKFHHQFIVHMTLLPIFVLAILVASKLSTQCMDARLRKRDPNKYRLRKAFTDSQTSRAVVLIILLLYPGLATKIFSLFRCIHVNGLKADVLLADFAVSCDSDEFMSYSAAGIVFLIVYILGIPCSMAIVLYKNRKHLHDTSSPRYESLKRSLGGMYLQYDDEQYYFEIVLMAAPYKSNDDDVSSFVTSLALLVTMVIGFSLLTDDKEKPSFSVGSMTALLLVINLLCIVYELIMMLIPCVREIRQKKEASSSDVSAQSKKSSTWVFNMDKNPTKVRPIEDNASESGATGDITPGS